MLLVAILVDQVRQINAQPGRTGNFFRPSAVNENKASQNSSNQNFSEDKNDSLKDTSAQCVVL